MLAQSVRLANVTLISLVIEHKLIQDSDLQLLIYNKPAPISLYD